MKKIITVSIVDDEPDLREHIAGYLAAAGNVQPDVAEWNRLGYGNNAIQVVTFDVR